MENKVSDEKLQLFAGMETIDAVDKTVKSMASELLALRADAETSQNHNAAVIDPLVTQLRDAGFTGTLSEMIGQACELREKYPRVFKLIDKGEYFLVVAKHEPYFVQAYGLICEQEMKQGTWSEFDEIAYQKNTAVEK
jgi:hypothetical protein